MDTKYGKLNSEHLWLYLERLIHQLYKLMPMKEKNDITYDMYLSKLTKQLFGGSNILPKGSMFLEILFNLESLSYVNDIKVHNSIVKENISMCQREMNRIKKELEG